MKNEIQKITLPKLLSIAVCAALCINGSQQVFGQAQPAPQERKIILVVGAQGTTEYGEKFEQWTDGLEEAVAAGSSENPNLKLVRVGGKSVAEKFDQTDLQRLKVEIENSMKARELWVVLIGHGTDDGKNSKFNLAGPDLTAKQLNGWLTPLPCRCVIVNCSSASGAFINKLKSKNRIVVTATRSSAQYNFARFGEHFLQAIGDPTFDLDKDQQISLLEAFVAGSKRTEDFYTCLLYTSPSPRDATLSRMPSSA